MVLYLLRKNLRKRYLVNEYPGIGLGALSLNKVMSNVETPYF
jgi:hypothetical protein